MPNYKSGGNKTIDKRDILTVRCNECHNEAKIKTFFEVEHADGDRWQAKCAKYPKCKHIWNDNEH